MVTSKQPNSRQEMTGIRTRSGPVKMLQGIGYIEFTENSCQDRGNSEVW